MQDIRNGVYEENLKNDVPAPPPQHQWSVPEFNADEYRQYVDEFDITEEQKNELLRILWQIAITFVDLGFGVESIQRILPGLAEISSPQESDGLKQAMPTSQFNTSANAQADSEKDSE